MSKCSWLRRQRTAPKHNFGRDAVRQEGRFALAANARECRKVHRISAERQMDWLRRGGHRGAQRAVGEVRRNAAVVFQQTRLKRGSATAHERLLGTHKREPMHDQRKLVGALSAQNILLYTQLLKWYLEHGLKITEVHRTLTLFRKRSSRGS